MCSKFSAASHLFLWCASGLCHSAMECHTGIIHIGTASACPQKKCHKTVHLENWRTGMLGSLGRSYCYYSDGHHMWTALFPKPYARVNSVKIQNRLGNLLHPAPGHDGSAEAEATGRWCAPAFFEFSNIQATKGLSFRIQGFRV